MTDLRSTSGHRIRALELPNWAPPPHVLLSARYGPSTWTSRGVRRWYAGSMLHRTDGPAVESDQLELWYEYSQLHREGGPASIERAGARYFLRDVEFHWTLPPSLWAVAIIRNQLLDKVRKSRCFDEHHTRRQRRKALTLLRQHTHQIEAGVLRAIVREAWTASDADLRRWGQQAATLLASNHTSAAGGRPPLQARASRSKVPGCSTN